MCRHELMRCDGLEGVCHGAHCIRLSLGITVPSHNPGDVLMFPVAAGEVSAPGCCIALVDVSLVVFALRAEPCWREHEVESRVGRLTNHLIGVLHVRLI